MALRWKRDLTLRHEWWDLFDGKRETAMFIRRNDAGELMLPNGLTGSLRKLKPIGKALYAMEQGVYGYMWINQVIDRR